jgi:hypothetical protein
MVLTHARLQTNEREQEEEEEEEVGSLLRWLFGQTLSLASVATFPWLSPYLLLRRRRRRRCCPCFRCK